MASRRWDDRPRRHAFLEILTQQLEILTQQPELNKALP
jgi:hypothetical protein